jgi:hypothetical protein
MLRLQNNFTFDKFDKHVLSFIKGLKNDINDIAERVYKHFSKENLVMLSIWGYTKFYIKSILSVLSKAYLAYDKKNDFENIENQLDAIDIKKFELKKGKINEKDKEKDRIKVKMTIEKKK